MDYLNLSPLEIQRRIYSPSSSLQSHRVTKISSRIGRKQGRTDFLRKWRKLRFLTHIFHVVALYAILEPSSEVHPSILQMRTLQPGDKKRD